jgi:CRP/FNR family transcriptional regulator, cyclic AMP receptor protein
VLKNEARRYDVEALRDTRLAIMDRATFLWLLENSVVFNRDPASPGKMPTDASRR